MHDQTVSMYDTFLSMYDVAFSIIIHEWGMQLHHKDSLYIAVVPAKEILTMQLQVRHIFPRLYGSLELFSFMKKLSVHVYYLLHFLMKGVILKSV